MNFVLCGYEFKLFKRDNIIRVCMFYRGVKILPQRIYFLKKFIIRVVLLQICFLIKIFYRINVLVRTMRMLFRFWWGHCWGVVLRKVIRVLFVLRFICQREIYHICIDYMIFSRFVAIVLL